MFSFIVEDGTGKTDATSYVAVSYVDSYASFLGDNDWVALSNEEKENAIIKTTMFFDDMMRFKGELLDADQSLNWPRKEFVDNNGRTVKGVPDVVKQSVAQLSIFSIEEPLTLNEPVLEQQSWGDASESYMGGYVEDESKVSIIKNTLTRLGYGTSITAFVTSVRA